MMLWGCPSHGGNGTLIKSIARSIPMYIMSIFKLPLGLCDDLNEMIRNYWWGSYQGKRKAQGKSWEKKIKPKGLGGMGFCDFRLFNQALLARQAWRLITNPESFCPQLLKDKYYPQ